MIAPDNVAEAIPGSRATPTKWSGAWLTLCGLAVITLLPFIAKPFNIDDPVYLAVAQQIVKSPLDFYGFEFNWYGTLQQVTSFHWYAPASAYFMAIIGSTVGWSEIAMHAAFFLPAIGLLLGTYDAAKRLCDRPLLASTIA